MSAENIREAAIEAFATHGYHGASLRQIAKASGVTLGTLYHYFPSKEDLLASLMRDVLDPLIEMGYQVQRDVPNDPSRQLYEVVRRFLLMILDRPRLAIIADQELRALTGDNANVAVALRDEFDGIIRGIISDGAERQIFRVADAKMATFAILAIANQPIIWFHPEGDFSKEDVAVAHAFFALRVLGVKDEDAAAADPSGRLEDYLEQFTRIGSRAER